MVYIFLSESNSYKDIIIKKFTEFIQFSNKNWRKPVFYVNLSEHSDETKVPVFLAMVSLITSHDCDCIVNSDSFYLQNRETFLEKLGTNVLEIQLVNTRTTFNIQSGIVLDIVKTTPTVVFNQLISYFKQ